MSEVALCSQETQGNLADKKYRGTSLIRNCRGAAALPRSARPSAPRLTALQASKVISKIFISNSRQKLTYNGVTAPKHGVGTTYLGLACVISGSRRAGAWTLIRNTPPPRTTIGS